MEGKPNPKAVRWNRTNKKININSATNPKFPPISSNDTIHDN